MTKLKKGVDSTKAGVKLANDDGDVAFSQAITPFLNTAEATLSAIQSRSSEIKEQFAAICKFLGEPKPPSTKPEDLFELIDKFVSIFASTKKKVVEREERLRKAEMRKSGSTPKVKPAPKPQRMTDSPRGKPSPKTTPKAPGIKAESRRPPPGVRPPPGIKSAQPALPAPPGVDPTKKRGAAVRPPPSSLPPRPRSSKPKPNASLPQSAPAARGPAPPPLPRPGARGPTPKAPSLPKPRPAPAAKKSPAARPPLARPATKAPSCLRARPTPLRMIARHALPPATALAGAAHRGFAASAALPT